MIPVTNPKHRKLLARDRPVRITQKMILAGVDALATWKLESDYVSERQAVKEIFEAMWVAIRFHKKKRGP